MSFSKAWNRLELVKGSILIEIHAWYAQKRNYEFLESDWAWHKLQRWPKARKPRLHSSSGRAFAKKATRAAKTCPKYGMKNSQKIRCLSLARISNILFFILKNAVTKIEYSTFEEIVMKKNLGLMALRQAVRISIKWNPNSVSQGHQYVQCAVCIAW